MARDTTIRYNQLLSKKCGCTNADIVHHYLRRFIHHEGICNMHKKKPYMTLEMRFFVWRQFYAYDLNTLLISE